MLHKIKDFCWKYNPSRQLILSVFYFITDYVTNHIVEHIPFWHIRRLYLRIIGAKIGKRSQIDMGITFLDPNRLVIGEHSHVNRDCLLDARGRLIIGKCVSISHRVAIMTGTHDYQTPSFGFKRTSIVIGDYVWIGVNVTIVGNVEIGDGAVICAGAVVTKNVSPYSVVAGIPAKEIHKRNKQLEYIPLKDEYNYPQFS